MSIPIPSLSALVLVCGAFPVHAFRLAAGAWWRLPALVVGVAALAVYVSPSVGVTRLPPHPWWYAVAAGVGVLVVGLEFGVGAGVALARGRRVRGIGVHERASLAVVSVVVVGAAEEVIFRGVGQHLLALYWPGPVVVALVAVVYGVNHLYFGWLTVAQKIATGVVFGGLYALSGGSVLVPVLAHVVQNLLVVVVLGARK